MTLPKLTPKASAMLRASSLLCVHVKILASVFTFGIVNLLYYNELIRFLFNEVQI